MAAHIRRYIVDALHVVRKYHHAVFPYLVSEAQLGRFEIDSVLRPQVITGSQRFNILEIQSCQQLVLHPADVELTGEVRLYVDAVVLPVEIVEIAQQCVRSLQGKADSAAVIVKV